MSTHGTIDSCVPVTRLVWAVMGANGQHQSQPGVPPPGAHIGPAPLTTVAGTIPGSVYSDGKARVMCRFESVNGSFVFLLDPDHAENFGRQVVASALKARSGLIVPDAPPPDLFG